MVVDSVPKSSGVTEAPAFAARTQIGVVWRGGDSIAHLISGLRPVLLMTSACPSGQAMGWIRGITVRYQQ